MNNNHHYLMYKKFVVRVLIYPKSIFGDKTA